jgi:hypothetical protein
VRLNARAGLRTVVHDRRIWSSDVAIREEAIAFWTPVLEHIAAWDMGDEFQPDHAEWGVLVECWRIVRTEVEPRTGVHPYTNHVVDAVARALEDLPGSEALVSFDHYNWVDLDIPASCATCGPTRAW